MNAHPTLGSHSLLVGHGRAMPNYKRPKVPGATVFFTVTLAARGSSLLVDQVAALRQAVRATRQDHPLHIDAWVVLPDHLHAVWTLPEGDCDFATRWSVIKARFSRQLPEGHKRSSHVKRRERGIWQRRFWEHHIRGARDYAAAVSHCHMNPVKHGFVERPQDWLYSSVHREIHSGRWAA